VESGEWKVVRKIEKSFEDSWLLTNKIKDKLTPDVSGPN